MTIQFDKEEHERLGLKTKFDRKGNLVVIYPEIDREYSTLTSQLADEARDLTKE